jgi:hypothetical protein
LAHYDCYTLELRNFFLSRGANLERERIFSIKDCAFKSRQRGN